MDVPYSVDVKLEIESGLVDVVDVAIDSVEGDKKINFVIKDF